MTGLKKLAIISTFDDLCGIAGYTRALVKQLEAEYEVTIFDLDQYLLRSTMHSIRKLGYELISDIAGQLQHFDYINIQLEHGTLGATHADIVRRFRALSLHDKPLTVTFHTVLPMGVRGIRDLLRAARHLDRRSLLEILSEMRVARELGHPILRSLVARQKRARTSAIFHTRRDARNHKLVFGLERTFDHPLVFYGTEGKTAPDIVDVAMPTSIRTVENPVIVGLFGFVSPYKGILTAVRALRKLPPNYHLVIFGGLHPNEIRKGYSIHPHLQEILDLIVHNADDTAVLKRRNGVTEKLDLHSQGEAVFPMVIEGLHDLSDRVHFMGALKDEEFASAMTLCDVVVLPYEEVGQSSSGPLAIACDIGARIICSRNKAFLQYERYNPNRLNFFDIGNYLELAQRVQMVIEQPKATFGSRYTVETNRATYKASLEMPTDQVAEFSVSPAGIEN